MMLQRKEEEKRSTFTAHKYVGTDVITLSCQNLAASFFRIFPFAYFNLGMLGVGKAQLVPL